MKKNFYELTYIINPVLDDEKFSEIAGQINKLIEDNDGEIVDLDEWGLRKLAYDINGKSNGYFVNMYFKAASEVIPTIERNLRINEDLLRYLTLRYDPKMLRYYDKKQKGELPSVFEPVEEEQTEEED